MEVEKMWEFRQEVEIMEEEEELVSGGLQTRERKKRLGNGNGEEEKEEKIEEGGVLEEHRSVSFAPNKGEEKEKEKEEEIKKEEGEVLEEHRSVFFGPNKREEKEEEIKKEEGGVFEEHRSVFFDPNKGLWKCRHCDWTYRLSSPCRDDILSHQGYCQIARDLESLAQIESFYDLPTKGSAVTDVAAKTETTEVVQLGAQKDKTNGTASSKNKELDTQDIFIVQETNGKLENGSNSNGSHEVSDNSETKTASIIEPKVNTEGSNGTSEVYNGSITWTSVHEIEEQKVTHVNKGKVNIEEYDLHKILDEQETHDLYCPNCNSCITRRVILRKRKRTVRQVPRDEPPKRPQHAEPSAIASAETADQRQDQELPCIFRCLSCFSFFIPTDCGFNIFRLFERKEVNQDQEIQIQHTSTSHQMSENCGSWLLSCFQSGDSPRKGSDQDQTKNPLSSDFQRTEVTTSSVVAETSSAQSQAITGKTEQANKPLLSKFQGTASTTSSVIAETSSSQSQATTGKTEQENNTLLSGFQGTAVTVSSVAAQTSSVVRNASTGKSNAGIVHTEITHVSNGQQDVARQEQIPLSKPQGEIVAGTTYPSDKGDVPVPVKNVSFQETTSMTSKIDPFISQAIPVSEVKVQSTNQAKIVAEGIIPVNGKPTPLRPQVTDDTTSAAPVVSPRSELLITVGPTVPGSDQRDEWNILKAIVYGGLVESITSLSIVSAAAAGGSKTLDIFILGLANLIGGLIIILHNLTDLKNLQDVDENNERVGYYWEHLGRRSKFLLHMVVAILSYILFGMLPPVIYGFSFRKSDNREHKIIAVAAASLLCIGLLAIGKAHVRPRRTYIKTLLYYLTIAVGASGLSYVAGALITRLLVHFGLIDQGASPPAPAPPSLFPDMISSRTPAWASY